jgi:Ni/Co efflux regulator RcnB
MKKILTLAAAASLFAFPALAQTASPAPETKPKAEVTKPEHAIHSKDKAKGKSAESQAPKQVAAHPSDAAHSSDASKTDSSSN